MVARREILTAAASLQNALLDFHIIFKASVRGQALKFPSQFIVFTLHHHGCRSPNQMDVHVFPH